MITREKIKKEVDNLPNNLLEEVFRFLKKISGKNIPRPANKSHEAWEKWWEGLKNFSPDFMNERGQSKTQTRENLFD